jgi:hypothetical protein
MPRLKNYCLRLHTRNEKALENTFRQTRHLTERKISHVFTMQPTMDWKEYVPNISSVDYNSTYPYCRL